MARFTSEFSHTFRVYAPMDKVRTRLTDLNVIKRFQTTAESITLEDGNVLAFVHRAKSAHNVSFQAQHKTRYTLVSPELFEWKSLEGGNMSVHGQLRFTQEGAQVRLDWLEKVEAEIPVGLILGKLIGPIAQYEMKKGSKEFAEAMVKFAVEG